MSHIIERDFRGVDLNLLVSFLVLVRERSVSRAAAKLFLGQPAVSGALARLRELTGDELLVRTAQGMVPTPRALALADQLAPALESVRGALTESGGFDPSRGERSFRLGMPDWMEAWLMPGVLAEVAQQAPGVRLAVRASDRSRASRMLEAGEMDLGLSVFDPGPAWQRMAALGTRNYRCVYHPDQVKLPPSGRLTRAHFLRLPHLFISYQGDFEGQVDTALAALGAQRRVLYATPHFGSLPGLLARLPAVATVPELLVPGWRQRFGLQAAAPPLKLPDYTLSCVWHARHDGDPALRWLRELLQRSAAALLDGAGDGQPRRQSPATEPRPARRPRA